MFKVTITEDSTEMKGTRIDLLAGLLCYVDALIENKIPKDVIGKVLEKHLKAEKDNRTKTIVENEKIKIQEIDLNGLSQKEAEAVIKKELFDKFFR